MSTNPRARAWLDVDAAALTANLTRIRSSLAPGVRVLPMVKADAYGLGMAHVVATLEHAGADGFGVATVEEGIRLRSLGVQGTVVVFSPTPPASVEPGLEAELVLSVGSLTALAEVDRAAKRVGKRAEIHLDVDTGMGRSGVDWRVLDRWMSRFVAGLSPSVRWTGIFTHLHSAEDDPESVREQARRFRAWTEVARLHRPGILRHMLNSAGVFHVPEMAGELVRPGIFLYGGRVGSDVPSPTPVIALRARVVHVRDVEPGATVGYGATHTAQTGERWATLAIGYGDGWPRVLGNRGEALVRGVRVPMIGRVSMDVTVVNITGLEGVGVGDVATLIGGDGGQEIALDDVARKAGTISYEVLTGFTGRLPRVWEGLDGD